MAQKHKTYQIRCGKCKEYILTYHKYGAGKGILRLYLAHIVAPDALANLIHSDINSIKKVPNLQCANCEAILGVPALSKGQRWVFRMRKGFFHRKLEK